MGVQIAIAVAVVTTAAVVGVHIAIVVAVVTTAALVAGVQITAAVVLATIAALVAGVQITAAVVLAMTAALVVGVPIAAVVGVQTAAAVVAVDLVAIGNHLCLSRIVKTRTLKRNDKRYEAHRNSTQTLAQNQFVYSYLCPVSLRGTSS